MLIDIRQGQKRNEDNAAMIVGHFNVRQQQFGTNGNTAHHTSMEAAQIVKCQTCKKEEKDK
jgi:hypothetical protein